MVFTSVPETRGHDSFMARPITKLVDKEVRDAIEGVYCRCRRGRDAGPRDLRRVGTKPGAAPGCARFALDRGARPPQRHRADGLVERARAVGDGPPADPGAAGHHAVAPVERRAGVAVDDGARAE